MILDILRKLETGDLRTIGKADEVVEEVLKNPELFNILFQGLYSENPGLRMRSADALEKISAKNPKILQPFRAELINKVSQIKQQEVQWHLAQMFSYLDLDRKQQNKVKEILFDFIDNTKSNIVKVFSMQTLAELAKKNEELKPVILRKIKSLLKNGSPAVVSRSKKLLKFLED